MSCPTVRLTKWTSVMERSVSPPQLDNRYSLVSSIDTHMHIRFALDQLKVDQVLVAVGLQPNTSLAGPAGLEVDPTFGGYRVNSELQACSDVWVVSVSQLLL